MAEVASAFVSLMPSARGFGSKLDSEISPAITSSGKKGGLSFGKLFAAGAALGIGAKAFSFLGDSLAEATDAAVVGSRTENVIAKMGNAANISADQVAKLAGSISNKTAIDDEAIQAGQNMLLTFGQVRNEVGKGNDIFSQTSRLMVDMSAAMGTDAKAAALQLGKALNDPTKGVTALARSGVSFTQQQKDQIKVLQESGNILGAQKIILGEVEKQFGGAGAAMATPGERAKVAWGNLAEQFGTIILPAFNSVANVVSTRIIPAISSFIAGMQSGTGAGGRFAAILKSAATALGTLATFINSNRAAVGTFVGIIGTVILVTKAWRAAQLALNFVMAANPIGLVVVAIAALAAGLVFAYKKSETFRKVVDAAFAGVKSAATAVASFFTTKVPAAFNAVTGAATSAYNWVKGNWPAILAILTGPFGLAALAIVKNWDSIKAGGETALNFIKSIPGKITAVFATAGTLLLGAGGRLMDGLRQGIENKIEDAVQAVRDGLSRIKDLLPGSPIKNGPLKGWNGGTPGKLLMEMLARGLKIGSKSVQAEMTNVVEALGKKLDSLKSKLSSLTSDFSSLAGSVASAFNPDVFGLGGKDAVTEEIDGIVTVLSPATTALQEFMGGLTGNNSNLTAMLAAFDQLKAAGASTGFLSSLFQSGNTQLATQLATAGPAAVQQASALFDQNASLAATLGGKVATNELGPKMESVRVEIAELRKDMKALLPLIAKDVEKGAEKGTRAGNDDRSKDAKQRERAGR